MTASQPRPRLQVFGGRGQSLVAAIAAFAATLPDEGAVGFALAADAFSFLRLDRSGTVNGPRGPADVATAYEARIFHEHAELRWLRDPRHESRNSTVLLTDGTCRVDLPALPFDAPLLETLEQTYVLWGKAAAGTNDRPGWTRLTTARIGGLDVPLAGVREGRRVGLWGIEYLGEFADGNVAVVEERLCGLTTFEDRDD